MVPVALFVISRPVPLALRLAVTSAPPGVGSLMRSMMSLSEPVSSKLNASIFPSLSWILIAVLPLSPAPPLRLRTRTEFSPAMRRMPSTVLDATSASIPRSAAALGPPPGPPVMMRLVPPPTVSSICRLTPSAASVASMCPSLGVLSASVALAMRSMTSWIVTTAGSCTVLGIMAPVMIPSSTSSTSPSPPSVARMPRSCAVSSPLGPAPMTRNVPLPPRVSVRLKPVPSALIDSTT